LNYIFPPTISFDERRPDDIGVLSLSYKLKSQSIGFATMYHLNDGTSNWYGMISASGGITEKISYYTELAKNVNEDKIYTFSNESPFALYGSITYIQNEFGLSAEYKNYNNFFIGSGINEPPALVKEHTYKVLNRSIHVLEPTNEKGYQIEIFYTFPDLSVLTFNNTLAINDLDKYYKYSEYFIEYLTTLIDRHELKIFVDYANDPIKLEEDRFSAGSYFDWKISKNLSLITNYEYQSFKRTNDYFQNQVLTLGFSYKSKIFFNIESEYSDDSFLTDEGSKLWLGVNTLYRLKSGKHTLQLFVGERRGGPACSAGVCYEVLDFKGLELRISSRL
jgi:hypothetical protein